MYERELKLNNHDNENVIKKFNSIFLQIISQSVEYLRSSGMLNVYLLTWN